MDWEIGSSQNLLSLISIVEHTDLDQRMRRQLSTVIYEVIRQITTEQKAVFLLQRYGISKLLMAVKNHAPYDSELKRLIEDLTQKLVATGKNCLSVNVLFMLAQSTGISDVHPRLCKTSWDALVSLSEKQSPEETKNTDSDGTVASNINREGDFENFIPKFIQIVRSTSGSLIGSHKAEVVD